MREREKNEQSRINMNGKKSTKHMQKNVPFLVLHAMTLNISKHKEYISLFLDTHSNWNL